MTHRTSLFTRLFASRADGTSPATDVVSFVLVFGGFALACMI